LILLGWLSGKVLNDIDERLVKLMGAFEDFVAAQTAHNTAVSVSLDGISGDINNLNAQIAALQAAAGGLTAEQQTALDALSAAGAALEAKAAALDALTPPVAPAP
jgi:hypothetical protein